MGVGIDATRDPQIDQGRVAGGRGGGPNTEQGKEVVRWNATRHGIRSPAPVVPGVEKPEDWVEYRDGMLEDLAPLGSLELALAERVALLSWRLHRVTRYETETIARSQERVVEDLRDRRSSGFGYGYSSRGPAHPEDALAAPKEARQTERLLKKFADYPDEKKLSGPDANAVLWAVAGRVEDEIDLEELELPGVPEWAGLYGDTSEWDGWSVGLVRGCLSLIVSAAGEDLEALMDGARERARLDVISAKSEAEMVEEQLQNMRRERLLPDEKILEKVSRFEAHLSRLMFKALHELEALQVRRSGGSAHLARLDVDGLAAD
jgi:hypothetical protein